MDYYIIVKELFALSAASITHTHIHTQNSHLIYSLTYHFYPEIVQKVNELIATGQYGRLFAVVHFASRQWKVTSEDLILLNNDIPAECGDRIRMEKVSFILAIALSSYIRHISLVSSFFKVIGFPMLLDGCQIGC